MGLFVNFCHAGGGSPIPKCKCQTKNYHLCENQKCTLQGLIGKINFKFFEQSVLKRRHGQSAIREKFPNNPIIDFSASLSLCYGASLCYGVNLCYGVSPCYDVSLCHRNSPYYGVSPYYVCLGCLCYGVSLCYRVGPCYGVSLCYAVIVTTCYCVCCVMVLAHVLVYTCVMVFPYVIMLLLQCVMLFVVLLFQPVLWF